MAELNEKLDDEQSGSSETLLTRVDSTTVLALVAHVRSVAAMNQAASRLNLAAKGYALATALETRVAELAAQSEQD